ncbi:hypothetical protein ACFL7D_04290 [candidate division KSB1 bacterium]
MEIGIVSDSLQITFQKNFNSEQKRNNSIEKSDYSISVTYEHIKISAEKNFYDKFGKVQESNGQETEKIQENKPQKELNNGEVAEIKQLIHEEVLKQVKGFLGAFFEENPEAVEQISRGEIPEYFNVENTAKRILDIYFVRFEEGEDREEFVARAKSIINQAYGDVEGMVGDLPDIVQKTREKIMGILDRFAQGEDVSEFMGYKIGENKDGE